MLWRDLPNPSAICDVEPLPLTRGVRPLGRTSDSDGAEADVRLAAAGLHAFDGDGGGVRDPVKAWTRPPYAAGAARRRHDM